MSIVTVTGASGVVQSVTVNGDTNLLAAQFYAAVVNTAAGNGSLYAQNLTSGGAALPTPPSGTVSEAVVTTGGAFTVPAGYSFLTDNATAPTTITGSGGTPTTFNAVLAGPAGTTYFAKGESGEFLAGGGANSFTGPTAAGGGSYFVATGAGNDTISTGSGNDTIDPGAGSNQVFLGTGNNIIVSEGTDTIVGGAGTSYVYLQGSGDVVTGGTGPLTVSDLGSGNTITLGSGGGTIFGGANEAASLAGAARYVGGSGNDSINVGSAAATIFAGSGNVTVTGPAAGGSLQFNGGAGLSTVFGGAVPATLFGGAGGTLSFITTGTTNPSSSGNILTAGAGNETINGASTAGGNSYRGGTGNDSLHGGTGADSFVLGSGNTTITGGGGADVYNFTASLTGGSNVVITDFNTTNQKVTLSGYANEAGSVASETTVGGSATVTLSDNTKITFTGVSTVTSSSFNIT